jgi:uncharacterized delta-60 repeat protein
MMSFKMGDPIVHKPSPASPSFNRVRNQLRRAAQPVVEHLEGRRMLYAGQLDAAFGTGGITKAPLGATKQFNDTVVLGDGRILAAGTGVGGSTGIDFTVARFTTSGALDSTFGGGDGIVHTDFFGRDDVAKTIELVAGGKFVVGGTVGTPDGPTMLVARYNADGTLDTTFGTAGRASIRLSGSDAFADLAVQPDGKIVVLGDTAGTEQTKRDLALIRFNADGSPDTSFGSGDGIMTADPIGMFYASQADAARSVALQSNGRIIVFARGNDFNLSISAFTPDGASYDTGFNRHGLIVEADQWQDVDGDVIVAPDDSVVISHTTGNYQRPFLGKRIYAANGRSWVPTEPAPATPFPLLPNWTREDGWPHFDADYAWGLDVVLQSDGKLLQSGTINGRFCVVRYLASGYLDTGFGAGGIATVDLGGETDMPDAAYAIALTADGQILLAGTYADGHQAAIVRLHAASPAVGNLPAPRAWPLIRYDVEHVTINTDNVLRIVGTESDDEIYVGKYDTYTGDGIRADEFAFSLSGVNIQSVLINGKGGNDRIWVKDGWGLLPIEIWGGAGNDTIIGGPRNDTIFGNLGKDYIEGGGGHDLLHGNGGHDRIVGNLGADRIFGDAGLDLLESGPGADRLFGGIDGDTIAGGAGPDTMYGEHGADTMTGGGGVDRAFNVAPMDTVLNVPIVSATTVSPPTSSGALLLQARVTSAFRTLEGDDAIDELL